MSLISESRAADMLEALVAIPSVNPMGASRPSNVPVEKDVNDWIERSLAPYGLDMTRTPCGDCHENLLVSVPGERTDAFGLFEAHVDTVPADEWADRAFAPRRDGDNLFGRGACDNKGSLTAMLLAVLDLLESKARLPRTLLLLAAGDEEYAKTGIKQFVSDSLPLAFAVVGEGTRLAPVVQHKGAIRWDIAACGKSAHTAWPELGRNAILDIVSVVEAIREYERMLQNTHRNPYMSGPTLTVTKIAGGRTRNAVPDACTVAVDLRVLPGMAPEQERDKLIAYLDALDCHLIHRPIQLCSRPLNTDPNHPFSQTVLEICQRHISSEVELTGVPYGTDASCISDAVPTIVIGPGDLTCSAHGVDEYISIAEVTSAARIYRDIMLATCK